MSYFEQRPRHTTLSENNLNIHGSRKPPVWFLENGHPTGHAIHFHDFRVGYLQIRALLTNSGLCGSALPVRLRQGRFSQPKREPRDRRSVVLRKGVVHVGIANRVWPKSRPRTRRLFAAKSTPLPQIFPKRKPRREHISLHGASLPTWDFEVGHPGWIFKSLQQGVDELG